MTPLVIILDIGSLFFMCIYLFIFNGHMLFAIDHSIGYEKFQQDHFMCLKLLIVKFRKKQAI